MNLVSLSCPNCGATLQVNPELKQAQCNYCGNLFYMDDEVRHIQYDNAEGAGYMFEKGRQRAQAEYNSQQLYQRGTINFQQPVPQKKKMTWLWVLGWIFIFPVPLTILMLRNKELNAKARYIIIAVAWVAYLIIGIYGKVTNPETTTKQNGGTGIEQISLGYRSDLKISTGETISDQYIRIRIDYGTDLKPGDIEFISDNPSIAEVSFFGVKDASNPLSVTYYYEVKGVSAGETTIYAKSKVGDIVSEKRKVIVK